MSEHGTPEEGEWEDWAEVAAADLAEPTFQALVGEIDARQETWASELTGPLVPQREAPHFALLTSSLRTGADADLRKPAVTSPAA